MGKEYTEERRQRGQRRGGGLESPRLKRSSCIPLLPEMLGLPSPW